jgi:hypothetical protein
MTGDGVPLIPTMNGPYEVTGNVDIVAPDGSHRRARWTDA